MIAAWMMYTSAVTLLVLAATAAGEYLLRALAVPTRFLWALGMLLSLFLSGSALLRARVVRSMVGRPDHQPMSPVAPTSLAVRPTILSASRLERASVQSIHIRAVDDAAMLQRRLTDRLSAAPLERWNRLLVVGWLLGSGLSLGYLTLSLIGARRLRRGSVRQEVDGATVLVSANVGPAVVGVLRPAVVIPRWVLTLDESERRAILRHEREHAAAADPEMLFATALLLVLEPWNIPLWALLARLRLAVEADCDRRVLGAHGDVRWYGRLLLSVYERSSPGLSSALGFAGRPPVLERRVRRLTERPQARSAAAAGALAVATVSTMIACIAPAPTPERGTSVSMATRVRSTTTGTLAAPHVQPPVQRHEQSVITAAAASASATALAVAGDDETAGISREAVSSHETGGGLAIATASASVGGGEDCGFGARAQELCSADGPALIRQLDPTHLIIALREPGTTADATVSRLFLVTGREPMQSVGLPPEGDAHVEYQSGELFVTPRDSRGGGVLFTVRGNRIGEQHPDARSAGQMVGLAEYVSTSLTFGMIRELAPTATAACHAAASATVNGRMGHGEYDRPATGAACFAVDRYHVSFP